MHDTYAVVATCSAAFSGTSLTLHLPGCGHALWLRAATPAHGHGHGHALLAWQAHSACGRGRREWRPGSPGLLAPPASQGQV